jgi:hypothetical protein
MKRIFLTILTAGSLVIGLTTCKKEYPSPFTSPGGNIQITKPLVLHLVADEWTNYGSEVYVNIFHGILANANAIPDNVSVYLDSDKQDTAINRTPVTFEGHQLWASVTTTDIIIVYRCEEQPIPFRSLNIRAVVY